MKASQKERVNALHRVQYFLDQHGDAVGPVNQSRTRFALDDVVKQLGARAADQHAAEVAVKSRTEQKDELRETLHLVQAQRLAEIARAKLAGTPDITKLRLPPKDADDRGLVAAGDAMAQAAAKYERVFLDEQLPSAFIAELQAATDAVRKAIVMRDGSRADVRVATKAVEDLLTIGKSIVRILNGLVVKQLARRSELLAGWQQTKHPKAKPGVPQGTTRMAATPAATAAGPSALQIV